MRASLRLLAGPDEDEQALPPEGHAVRSRVFLLAAVVAVACAALAAGTGLFRGGARHLSLYQRTMEVAGEYRCPVCAGESAADSSAPAAIEIRHLVRKWLQEGESQAQIRANLVGDYGPSILLKPPASGLDVLVWAVPALAVALGAAGLALAFARWRRSSPAPAGAGPPAGLEAAGAAMCGDSASAGAKCGDATAGGTAAQGRLFEPEPAFEAPPALLPGEATTLVEAGARPAGRAPRHRYRRLMLPAGLALLALGVALWLVDRTSPELPGGTVTGSLSGLNVELEQAQALAAKDPVKALQIYERILASDPGQPIALTAEGWIYAEAGFAKEAMPLLDKAEKVDPSYGPAHLYRGLVLLDLKDRPAGVAELRWYLSHDPSPRLAKAAREALAEARAGASARPRAGKTYGVGSRALQ